MAAPGSARASRLDKLATDTGQFAILALDHIRSFATTLRPEDPDSMTVEEMLASKDRLIEGLSKYASAVLIDPIQVMSRLKTAAAPLGSGLIIGIEDGDYAAAAVSPRLLPGWTVERAARLNADAVKISFYFDPDEDTTAAERFVRETVRQCDLVDMPLFCEPLAQLGGGGDDRRKVIEGIRRFGSLGADVLKIQFPCDTEENRSPDSWAEACGEANELSPSPWALLSEGRDFLEFRELLSIACRAGASGFLAGRAVWQGAVAEEHSITTYAERLAELRSVAVSQGQSWKQRRVVVGPQNQEIA